MEAMKLLGIRVQRILPPTICKDFDLDFPLEPNFLLGERLPSSAELARLEMLLSFELYTPKPLQETSFLQLTYI